jgi:hypothetical protein
LGSFTLLHRFKPHHNELAAGYLGRLQTFNNATSWKELRSRVPKGTATDEKTNSLELLAEIAEIAPAAFCCTHTMVPFARAVANSHTEQPHGELFHERLFARFSLATPRSEQVFCEVCRRKQNKDFGYSWWSRELQLPGIYRCPEHNSILMKTSEETNFSFSPDRYTSDSVPVTRNPPQNNTVVDRYVAIANLMLQTTRPVPTREAAFKLGQRAKACGLRVGNKGQRASLEDLAREMLPAAWVDEFMPNLLNKKRLFEGPLVCATTTRPTSLTAALALALLFDSVKDAWDYWQTPLEDSLPEPRQNRRYPPDFWASEKMHALYTKHNGSIIEISKELGIEYGHVRLCLSNAGLPQLSRIHIERNGYALLKFLQGDTLEDSISTHGADRDKLMNLLRVAASPLMRALEQILPERESPESP